MLWEFFRESLIWVATRIWYVCHSNFVSGLRLHSLFNCSVSTAFWLQWDVLRLYGCLVASLFWSACMVVHLFNLSFVDAGTGGASYCKDAVFVPGCVLVGCMTSCTLIVFIHTCALPWLLRCAPQGRSQSAFQVLSSDIFLGLREVWRVFICPFNDVGTGNGSCSARWSESLQGFPHDESSCRRGKVLWHEVQRGSQRMVFDF